MKKEEAPHMLCADVAINTTTNPNNPPNRRFHPIPVSFFTSSLFQSPS